jgi:hypothetical protein
MLAVFAFLAGTHHHSAHLGALGFVIGSITNAVNATASCIA